MANRRSFLSALLGTPIAIAIGQALPARLVPQTTRMPGVLRTGGSLKDIVEYGKNFAASEYGNVFNRALRTYDQTYRSRR